MSEEQENNQSAAEETPVTVENNAPSKDDKNMALLTHLVLIFSCFVGPLIIWLIKKDEGGFVEEQAREALNFGITLTIAYFILTLSMVGLVLVWIVGLAQLIFPIIAAIKTSDGENYRYPFTLRLIK